MGYNPSIALLSFAVALYLVNTLGAGPLLGAFVAAIFPFLVNAFILYLMGFDIWIDVLSVANLMTLVVQFILAYLIFKKVRDAESLTATFVWSVGGMLALFFSAVLMQAFFSS